MSVCSIIVRPARLASIRQRSGGLGRPASLGQLPRLGGHAAGNLRQGPIGQLVLNHRKGLFQLDGYGDHRGQDDDERPSLFSGSDLLGQRRLEASTIWQLKAAELKKSNLLTLYRGGESFAGLGGLEALKSFCLRALRPKDARRHRQNRTGETHPARKRT